MGELKSANALKIWGNEWINLENIIVILIEKEKEKINEI